MDVVKASISGLTAAYCCVAGESELHCGLKESIEWLLDHAVSVKTSNTSGRELATVSLGPESIFERVIKELLVGARSKSELAIGLGHRSVSGKLNERIREMVADGLIEYTIPDKPKSRLQKYCLTEKGRKLL